MASGEIVWSVDVPGPATQIEILGEIALLTTLKPSHGGDYLYGVAKDSGRPRWAIPLHGAGSSVVGFGDLVVAIDEAVVSALDLGSGTSRWQASATRIFADSTYVDIAMQGDLLFLNDSNVVRAISLGDGSERWRTEVVADRDASFSPVLELDAGLVVAASWPASAAGLDSATGQAAWTWTSEPGYRLTEAPLVVEGVVMMALAPFRYRDFDGLVVGLDSETGAVLWSTPRSSRDTDLRMWKVPGGLIEAAWTQDSPVVRYDSASGSAEPVWAVDQSSYRNVYDIVVDGENIFVVADERDSAFNGRYVLVSVDANFVERWSSELPWSASVQIEADVLLTAGADSSDGGFVHAFEADTGQELWQVPFEQAVVDLRSSGGVAYVLSSDQLVSCD